MTLALMPARSRPRPSAEISMLMWAPSRPCGPPSLSLRRLAGGNPLGRRFDAVVGTVAHQMSERILDQIKHLAVQLGIGAAHRKLDILAELGAQVAHHARQFLPRI